MATTRDFDAERKALSAATFTLGGVEFRTIAEVRPEAMLAYEDMTTDAGLDVAMGVMDDLILSCIDPSQHDDWRRIRADDAAQLGLSTIQDVGLWLIEQVIARPTAPPSSSSAGPRGRRTGTSSTGASPSQVAVASAG